MRIYSINKKYYKSIIIILLIYVSYIYIPYITSIFESDECLYSVEKYRICSVGNNFPK